MSDEPVKIDTSKLSPQQREWMESEDQQDFLEEEETQLTPPDFRPKFPDRPAPGQQPRIKDPKSEA